MSSPHGPVEEFLTDTRPSAGIAVQETRVNRGSVIGESEERVDGAIVMADRNAASRDPEQLKKILILREHARADAWMRKDRRALEALLAPDFVEINSLGRFNREELLNLILPVLTLYEFTIEDPSVRITGEKSAVLSYRCHEWMAVDGKRIEGTFRIFASYTRDGNQYRLSMWESRAAE
jgi:hypothetical protein